MIYEGTSATWCEEYMGQVICFCRHRTLQLRYDTKSNRRDSNWTSAAMPKLSSYPTAFVKFSGQMLLAELETKWIDH
jgi:hypothetical protein